MAAIIVLGSLGVAALILIAACLYALVFQPDRQLRVMTRRLLAEQRVEHATRLTLRAMRDAAGERGA